MKRYVSKALAVCAFFAHFFAQTVAQTPISSQAEAHASLTLAKQFFNDREYLRAEQQAEAAYFFFKTDKESTAEDWAEAAFWTGQAAFKLEKYGGATPLFKESADIWEQSGQPLEAARAFYFLAFCQYYRDKVEEALSSAGRAWELRSTHLPPEHCDLSETQRLQSNIYLKKGEYAKAAQHAEQAATMARVCAGEESTQFADALGCLGIASIRLSDYERAVALQEQVLAIRVKLLPLNHPDIALSYMALGEANKLFYRYDEALFYYEKALAIRQANSDSNNSIGIAFVFSEIGQYYLAKKDFMRAASFFEKENEIMVREGATASSSYAYTCSDMARLYNAQRDYSQMRLWADKMVAVWRNAYPHPNTQLASMLTYSGSAKMYSGDLNAAFRDFDECKYLYTKLLGEGSYLESKADYWLGNANMTSFVRTPSLPVLEKARWHYQRAVEGVERQIRLENSAEGQKKVLGESVPVFEKALYAEITYLEQVPKSAQNLERAWQLCESVHSQLLLLAVQETNARHFAGIPDEYLLRDSSYKAQIVELTQERRKWIQNKGLEPTDSSILALNARIFGLKAALEQSENWVEQHYPRYAQLKHAKQSASIRQIQQRLRPEQSLLEYFVGDSAIFVFVMQVDTAVLLALHKNGQFEEWVAKFREGITGYHTNSEKSPALYETTVRQYADAGWGLYQALLAPLSDWLRPELIVVPDEKLANLPFDALLTVPPRDVSNFVTYDFVLRKHAVQYAYSATMFQQMSERQHRKQASGVLALAPFFEEKPRTVAARSGERAKLGPLPYSGEEVARVAKRFGKNALVRIGYEASKSFFISNAARFSIVHFATHGKANNKAGELSYLAFAGTPEPELLFAGELYNLTLNADLVLLSACETAIGEEQRGEGVISLARAFAYAGARSMVASLWSANDRSTMLIVDGFYEGMLAGKPKHVALADAKRQYLRRNPGRNSHPFFWASFVGVGAW